MISAAERAARVAAYESGAAAPGSLVGTNTAQNGVPAGSGGGNTIADKKSNDKVAEYKARAAKAGGQGAMYWLQKARDEELRSSKTTWENLNDRINLYMGDYSKAAKGYGDAWDKYMTQDEASDYAKATKQSTKDSQTMGYEILGFLNRNKDTIIRNYGQDTFDGTWGSIVSRIEGSSSMLQGSKDLAGYYGNFQDADDFASFKAKTAAPYSTDNGRGNNSYARQELGKAAENASAWNAGADDRWFEQRYGQGDDDTSIYTRMDGAVKDMEEQRRQLLQQRKELWGGKGSNMQYFGQGPTYDETDQEAASREIDYQIRLLDQQIANATRRRDMALDNMSHGQNAAELIGKGYGIVQASDEQFAQGFAAPTKEEGFDYEAWALNNPEWQQWQAEHPGGTMEEFAKTFRADRRVGEGWTDQQRNQFYILQATVGQEAADRFALEVNTKLRKQKREDDVAATAEFFRGDDRSKEARADMSFMDKVDTGLRNIGTGALGIAGSVATAPEHLLNWVEDVAKGADSRREGYYAGSTRTRLTDYTDAAVSARAKALNEDYGTIKDKWYGDLLGLNGKGLGDIYQLAQSMAQSVTYGNVAGEAATLLMFFGQAADQSYQEAIDRGGSNEYATVVSLLSGLAEVAGEKIGLDHLLNPDKALAKGLLRYMLEQGGIEGAEEGVTDLMNIFGDALASRMTGNESEMQQKIRGLMESGMNYDEAVRQVWKDQAKETAWSVAGGFLSGFGSGVTQSFVKDKKTGTRAVGREIARKIGAKKDAASIAQDIKAKNPDLADADELGKAIYKEAHGQDLSKKQQEVIDSHRDVADPYLKDIQVELRKQAERNIDYKERQERAQRVNPTERVTIGDKTGNINGLRYDKDKGVSVELKLMDGSTETVSVDDAINASSAETGELLYSLAGLGQDAVAAYKLYEKGQAVDDFVMGMDTAINKLAAQGASRSALDLTMLTKNLTKAQKDFAYEIGHQRYEKLPAGQKTAFKANARVSMAGNVQGSNPPGVTGLREQSIVETNREARQAWGKDYKKNMAVLAAVSKATGLDVVVFSSKMANGSLAAARGAFVNSGTVYVDIYAGFNKGNADTIVARTVSHELTHYLEENAPEEYRALREFVVNNLAAMGGGRFEAAVQAKLNRSSVANETDAVNEVVADACEMMLTNSEMIQKLAAENSTLAERVWNYIKDVFAKLKAELTPDSEEAKWLQGKYDEMSKLWDAALESAVKSAKAIAEMQQDDVVELTNEAGETTAVASGNGTMELSLRTYDESGRDNLREFLDKRVKDGNLTKKEAADMMKQMDTIYEICQQYDDGTYAPFSAWSHADVVTYDGRPVFSVVKANGEYKLNLDFSLVCKKRRTLDAVFNEMIRQGIMDDFNMFQESIAKINDIIRENGFETACGLCFVDSKRYRQAMIADAFTMMYNKKVCSLVHKGQKLDYFNFGGNETLVNTGAGIDTLKDEDLNWTEIDKTMRELEKKTKNKKGELVDKTGTVEYKICEFLKNNPSARKLVQRGDFMSTKGFDALKTNNPELLSLYNSKKGAGGPKAAQSDVQYLNEIIGSNSFNKKAAYEVGGVRIQSFSDYVGRLVFDYVQMVGDLAAKGLPAHSYTKEYLYALQFGLTGIKINMSLVPDIIKDGIAPGLDANGNYAWKDGQSFGSTVYDNKGKRMTAAEGFELAKKIQSAKGYSKNCGTIAVGVSDAHILKMLNDPDIRMIIPYHKSSLNHIVAAMNNIDKYKDYTKVQNTRHNGKKLTGGDFNFNEALQRLGDAKAAANEYLKWCQENGHTPKFDQFAYHENYYKLLEDFSCYDNDGVTNTPMGAVELKFPTDSDAFGSMKDLIKAGLEEDAILQAKQDAAVPDIVKQVQAVLPGFEQGVKDKKNANKKAKKQELKAAASERESDEQQMQKALFRKNASDAERYRILNGKNIVPAVYKGGALDVNLDHIPGNTLEEKAKNLKAAKMGDAKRAIKILAEKLGLPKLDFHNDEIDIDFTYSARAAGESSQKQKQEYLLSLAKALTVFDALAKNAVPINIRGDIYAGRLYAEDATPTDTWYSCIAAYLDGDQIVPVKIEIDERKREKNRAHLIVAFSEFEAIKNRSASGVPGRSELDSDRKYASRNSVPPLSEIRIADIAQNVKADEYELLRDIPDGFLTPEQRTGKAVGQEMLEEHILDKIEDRARAGKIDAEYIKAAYEEAKITGDRETEDRLKMYAESGARVETDTARGENVELSERDNTVGDLKEETAERVRSYNQLKADNAALKRQVERLKRELKPTKQNTVRAADARKLAKELLSTVKSDVDVNELAGVIERIGNYLVQTETDELDYDVIRGWAAEVARDIVETAEEPVETGMEDVNKTLKQYLNGKRLKISKNDIHDLGQESLTAWKKSNPGIRVGTQDGLAVDVAYQELQDMLGEGLLPSDVMHPADQLNRISELLQDSSREETRNPFKGYEGEVIETLTEDIINAALGEQLRQTAPTFADKMEEMRIRNRQRVADIKENTQARIDEVRAKERAEKWKKVDSLRKFYQERERAAAAKRRETKKSTELRHKIRKLHTDLTRRLTKPVEGKYVPEPLIKSVAEVLDSFNLDSGKSERLTKAYDKLHAQYRQLQNAEGRYAYAFNPAVAEMLDKTKDILTLNEGKSIYEMDSNDLLTLYRTLQAVDYTVRHAVKAINYETNKNLYEIGAGMASETKAAKPISGKVFNSWLNSSMRPTTFFNRLGGWAKDSNWSMMADMLDKAQLKQTQIQMESAQFFGDLIKDTKNYDKFTSHKDLIDIGLKDIDGNTVKVPRDFAAKIYLDTFDADAARHLMYGAYTMPDFKEYYKSRTGDAYNNGTRIQGYGGQMAALYEELIEAKTKEEEQAVREKMKALEGEAQAWMQSIRDAISDNLGDYGMKWVKAWRDYTEYSQKVLNETTKAMYGFEKATIENYVPIHVDPNFRAAQFDSITKDISLENAGFMKDRVFSKKPMLGEGIVDVANMQIDKVAKYSAMMPAIQNFQKAYSMVGRGGTISVQDVVSNKFKKNGTNYIENILRDLTSPRRGEGGVLNDFLNAVRGNVALASLTLNPRVALGQTASYPTAAAVVGWKALAKAAADVGNNPIYNEKARAEVAKYSPLLWYRMQGFFNSEIGDLRNDKTYAAKINNRLKFLTGWINAMDGWTVGKLWVAAEYYVKDNYKGLSGEEFKMKQAEVFNQIVEKTQPNYTTFQRPDILRNPNAIYRQMTMFMTQRLQNVNILYDAVGTYNRYAQDLKAGRITEQDMQEARTGLLRAVSSQVAAAATIVVFKALADAVMYSMKRYRDDDDELTWASVLNRLVNDFGESLVSNFLWGSEFYSALDSILNHKIYYGISMGGVDTFKETIEQIVNTIKDPSKESAQKLAKAVAQFFGVPVNNLEKFKNAVAYRVKDAQEGNGFWEYASEIKKNNYTQARALFKAIQDGDQEKIDELEEYFGSKSQAQDALAAYIKKQYKAGRMTEDEAFKALRENAGYTKDDAYWAIQTINGGEKYNRWSDLEQAAFAGEQEAYDEAADFLGDHGYEGTEIRNHMKSAVHKWYTKGEEGRPRIKKEDAIKYLTEYAGMSEWEAKDQVREWTIEVTNGFSYSEIQDKFLDGDLDYSRAIDLLTTYGPDGETTGEVKALARKEAAEKVDQWRCEKETGIRYGNIQDAFIHGDITGQQAIDWQVKYGHKDREAAQQRVMEWNAAKDYGIKYGSSDYGIKDAYLHDKISAETAKAIMITYGGKSESDAEAYTAQYEFTKETGYEWRDGKGIQEAILSGKYSDDVLAQWEARANVSAHGSVQAGMEYVQVAHWLAEVPGCDSFNRTNLEKWEKYGAKVLAAGMTKKDFAIASEIYNKTHSDYDSETGESIAYSKCRKVLEQINEMNLTKSQKETLARSLYSQKSIRKAGRPW